MEHKVYLSGWSETGGRFRLWTRTKPRIRAEGATFDSAEQRLLEAILHAGGATHAVLEFTPPPPRSNVESKYLLPELFLIGGDDRFETNAPGRTPFERQSEREGRFLWADRYFDGPLCRECGVASAPRNSISLPLTYAPGRNDGAFGNVGPSGSMSIEIVSREFIDLLVPEERSRLTLRQVTGKRRYARFFELTGPPGPSFVSVEGLAVQGWRCSACNHATWGHWIEGFAIHDFVAFADLPHPLPSVFTIGRFPDIRLCVTGDRWRQWIGKLGVRGFTSRPLGVASDGEVVRQPCLPPLGSQRS